MTERKLIRCVLTDRQLIDAYERELYEQDLREEELIQEALREYFETEGEIRVR